MKFDIKSQCNQYVLPEVIKIVNGLMQDYEKEPTTEKFTKVVSNLPMGFQLTARITTNYLQLKTMYYQRRFHKLTEWRIFCDWAKSLPKMNRILKGSDE